MEPRAGYCKLNGSRRDVARSCYVRFRAPVIGVTCVHASLHRYSGNYPSGETAMRLPTILLLCTLPTLASADSSSDLGALGADAGVTEKEMRMLLGAPSSYANYRTSYGQARWKLHRLEVAEREAAAEGGPVLRAKHGARHHRRYAAAADVAPARAPVRQPEVLRPEPPPAETIPLPDD
jgi:hypothetical protein